MKNQDNQKQEALTNYNDIPQRFHKYPASDRAKKIVQDSLTIDSLFGVTWPVQFSSPEGPEFHDVMEHVLKGGIKVIAAAISADSAGTAARNFSVGISTVFSSRYGSDHEEHKNKIIPI